MSYIYPPTCLCLRGILASLWRKYPRRRKTVHVVFKYLSRSLQGVKAGRFTPSPFPADPWMFYLKTTRPLFSSSVFTPCSNYTVCVCVWGGGVMRVQYIHKVHIYVEYHSVLVFHLGLGTLPPPSLARECAPPPGTKGGRAHSPAGEGLGSPNSDYWKKKA